jgi:hypothetical protein
MTISSTAVEKPTRYLNTTGYAAYVVLAPNQANAAGGGAGTAVTTAVAIDDLPADLEYTVKITPSQACSASYSSKAATGFNVVLTPASGVTLAEGTFDVEVSWTA